MRTLLLATLLLLSCSTIYADNPQIKLPATVVPAAGAITELAPDSVFVIESEIPCIVLASRVGFVDVVQEVGPLRIRGRFSDGIGKVESRTYKGKHLWVIEATAPGEVELLVVPSGAEDTAGVIRRTLLIKGTTTPPIQPPITPPAPPQPPAPPGPTLPPTAPPQPDIPLIGLQQVVRDSIIKNVDPTQRAFASEIAKSYRYGADALAKGIWTPENYIQNQSKYTNSITGYQPGVWHPVFVDIANKLGEARTAGKLTTAKQWTAAAAELSVAFFQSFVSEVHQ